MTRALFSVQCTWVLGHCFWFVKENLNHTESVNNCHEHGMKLYEPRHGQDIALKVSKLGRLIFGELSRARIGMNDILTEGQFIYESDGTEVLAEKNIYGTSDNDLGWAFGQPNNLNNEDCVEIRPFEKEKGWFDAPCSDKIFSICEPTMHEHIDYIGVPTSTEQGVNSSSIWNDTGNFTIGMNVTTIELNVTTSTPPNSTSIPIWISTMNGTTMDPMRSTTTDLW